MMCEMLTIWDESEHVLSCFLGQYFSQPAGQLRATKTLSLGSLKCSQNKLDFSPRALLTDYFGLGAPSFSSHTDEHLGAAHFRHRMILRNKLEDPTL
jgi:hypothetical protein